AAEAARKAAEAAARRAVEAQKAAEKAQRAAQEQRARLLRAPPSKPKEKAAVAKLDGLTRKANEAGAHAQKANFEAAHAADKAMRSDVKARSSMGAANQASAAAGKPAPYAHPEQFHSK